MFRRLDAVRGEFSLIQRDNTRHTLGQVMIVGRDQCRSATRCHRFLQSRIKPWEYGLGDKAYVGEPQVLNC